MAGEGVKLHSFWESAFAIRVQWALKLKGVEYELVEEDLKNKSPELLQYNPVYKKVPVLLHNGNPIAESLVILEYIDEVWKEPPLLPQDPYERAQARFWSRFVDEKLVPALLNTFASTGEKQETHAKEAREMLAVLESGLAGRSCEGDRGVGFLDVTLSWLSYWTQAIEEVVDVKLVDETSMPCVAKHLENVLDAAPILKDSLPPRDKLLAYFINLHKSLAPAGVSS